jgi:hypothetical protein
MLSIFKFKASDVINVPPLCCTKSKYAFILFYFVGVPKMPFWINLLSSIGLLVSASSYQVLTVCHELELIRNSARGFTICSWMKWCRSISNKCRRMYTHIIKKTTLIAHYIIPTCLDCPRAILREYDWYISAASSRKCFVDLVAFVGVLFDIVTWMHAYEQDKGTDIISACSNLELSQG